MTTTKQYRTIGEVADLLDVKAHTIRFWEKHIPDYVPVRKMGRRLYSDDDVALLLRVKSLLYERGFKVNALRDVLAEPEEGVNQKILSELDKLKETIIKRLDSVAE